MIARATLIGLGGLALAGIFMPLPAVQPLRVEVITTGRFPIQGVDRLGPAVQVVVYDLDAIEALDRELGAGIPSDPHQARALIEQRLQGTLGSRYRQAYQGFALIQRYRLDRAPAVIFDGAAVVLGVTDLPAALAMYRHWRAQR